MRSVPQRGFSFEIQPMSAVQFRAETGSAEPGSRLPCPVDAPTLPVPAQDCLRLHDPIQLAWLTIACRRPPSVNVTPPTTTPLSPPQEHHPNWTDFRPPTA